MRIKRYIIFSICCVSIVMINCIQGSGEKKLHNILIGSFIMSKNNNWKNDINAESQDSTEVKLYAKQMKVLNDLDKERKPKQVNETYSPFDSWVGEYFLEECSGSLEEPPFMFLMYEIEIYKGVDQCYYAEVLINGQTTGAAGKARVMGDEKRIDLIFLEYLPEHMGGGFPNKKGSVLISFEKIGDALYTYWGEITPMLYANEESGKVYFEKVK